MPHDQAVILEHLAAGFSRFQTRWCSPDVCDPYTQLRERQQPKAMVIACSDARVDPAIVLDSAPGELFVVRNVANLVPPYEPDKGRHGVSAALEYAVRVLRVPDILIMGHARCGGFIGMADGNPGAAFSFLDAWMETAAEAVRLADRELHNPSPDERLRAQAMWGVRLSLRNLMLFPWIASEVNAGRLRLHGLYFDLLDGSLWRFDPQRETFVSLVCGAASGGDA